MSCYFEGTWQTFSAESRSLGSNGVTALLEQRAARHGMDVPTSLLNEMDCEREAIARIEAELEQMR